MKARSTARLLLLGLAISAGRFATAQGIQSILESATIYSSLSPNGIVFTSAPFPVCENYDADLRLRTTWTNAFQDQLYHEPILPFPNGIAVTEVTPNPTSVPVASVSNPAIRFVNIGLSASSQITSGQVQLAFRARSLGVFGPPVSTTLSIPVIMAKPPSGITYEMVAHEATDQPTKPWFSWQSEPNAFDYRLDVGSCANSSAQTPSECGGSAMSSDLTGSNCSGSIFCETSQASAIETTTALATNTSYQYRILSRNGCGITDEQTSSPVPRPFFRTAQTCFVNDQRIADGGALDLDIALMAGTPAALAENLRLTLHVDHQNVRDLVVDLSKTSPDRIGPVPLLVRPNATHCDSGDRIHAVFADDGVTLETGCSSTEPAIRGRIRPQGPLSTFSGNPLEGTWRLRIRDAVINGSDGRLKEWCISADAGAIADTSPPFTVIAVPWIIPYGGGTSLSTIGGAGQGPVSYSVVSGHGYCTLKANQVSAIGVGTCTIRATKGPEGTHPTQTSEVEIDVIRADQSSLNLQMNPSTLAYLDAAILTTEGGSGTGAVSFSVDTGTSACQVNGNSVTGIGVGQCTITATKAGDANYNPISSAPLVIDVGRAQQSPLELIISPDLFHVGTMANLTTSGGSGAGAVGYSIVSAGTSCEVTGQQLRGLAVGTCTVMATKSGDALYLPASMTNNATVFSRRLAHLMVMGHPLAPTFDPSTYTYDASIPNQEGSIRIIASPEDPASTLSANGVALSNGTPSQSIPLDEGHNEVRVVLTAQDNSTQEYSINVVRRFTQVITMAQLTDRVLGDPPFELSATGGNSGNSVIFSSASPTVCSVSGNLVTMLTAGNCSVRANQAGSTLYDPAPEVVRAFQVIPGADLRVVKSNGGTFVSPNAITVYQVDVSNLGPSAVTGARVFDLPPAQLHNVAWICISLVNAVCPIGGGFGQIDIEVDLASGSAMRFEMSGEVNAPRGSLLVNTATVSAPSGVVDRDISNNIARDVDIVESGGIMYAGFE